MLHDAYLIVREVGDRVEAADILSRFASILASTGRVATAARLLSCKPSRARTVRRHALLGHTEERRDFALIRAQLDNDAFDEA